MPQHSEVHTPPPGYWVDCDVDLDGSRRYVMGQLIDGSLIVISFHQTHIDAVEAANEHFSSMKTE